VHVLSFASLAAFTLSFFYAYGHRSLVFAPLFLSILVGFGMLIMGQSIAHAPEFIVGLLMLSVYSLCNVQRLQRSGRAFWYGLLGSVAVYFDLMDGNAALIAIMLCCQISIPYVVHAKSKQNGNDGSALWCTKISENLLFVLIGGCVAIAIRILGYSFFNDMSLFQGLHEWIAKLSFRISGDPPVPNLNAIDPGLYSILEKSRLLLLLEKSRLFLLGAHLVHHSHDPFQGMLSSYFAYAFYFIGFMSWLIATPLCVRLHRSGILPISATMGFFVAAAIVPAWYLALLEHSIEHPWMTGRLISSFCGLGMSLAVVTGLAIRNAHRDRKECRKSGE
jgi:hypothetical protein